MDEAHLVEHVKEAACFVSLDLPADLRAARSSHVHRAEYVLPDGLSHSRGRLRPVAPRGQQGDIPENPAQEQVRFVCLCDCLLKAPCHSHSHLQPLAPDGQQADRP